MMEDNGSKNILLSVLGVAILVVAVVGISFALFTFTGASDNNTISSGTIAMSFSESTNGISLTNALPETDDQGKGESHYFDFSVSTQASGTVSIPYTITITPVAGTGAFSGKDLADSQVKVYLTSLTGGTETEVVAPTLVSGLTASTITGRESSKTLYTKTVSATSTTQVDDYRLRMWVDENVLPVDVTADPENNVEANQYSGLQYTLKVNVDASAAAGTVSE